MDIVDSIERYLSGGDVSKGARTRMTRARDEIVRLRELCREAPHELTAEIAALRKDLDDALLALRHLRFIDHDSEHWWQAAIEEADAMLARFEDRGSRIKRASNFNNPSENRVAHKTHRCTYCGEPINCGDRYIFYSGRYDGEWVTNKMHQECDFMPYSNERPKNKI